MAHRVSIKNAPKNATQMCCINRQWQWFLSWEWCCRKGPFLPWQQWRKPSWPSRRTRTSPTCRSWSSLLQPCRKWIGTWPKPEPEITRPVLHGFQNSPHIPKSWAKRRCQGRNFSWKCPNHVKLLHMDMDIWLSGCSTARGLFPGYPWEVQLRLRLISLVFLLKVS